MQPQPTGVETDAAKPTDPAAQTHPNRRVALPRHGRLTAVELVDRTDLNNELVHERTFVLHTKPLQLRGNLFVVEESAVAPARGPFRGPFRGGRGWVFLKEAPLPHARATQSVVDIELHTTPTGYEVELHAQDGYAWHVLEYTGGPIDRAAALQRFQRDRWPGLPVKFITNTWGDRNRDSRINEAFILQELEAAARLGADMLQIDDGWQSGMTANAAAAQTSGGGAWEGFYDADPDFWTPDPKRFPNGLQAVVDAGKAKGITLGLWFAPDSSDDFANWERDADTLLQLHAAYGIRCFKLDSIDMRSVVGEQRVRQFISRVNERSGHTIVLDLDVTAGTRPGYFGLMEAATLFVENRYTDWHSYWPHATLRVLWKLSQWVDPRRLRMEFLNGTRNADKYADDPLAPSLYDPAYLFATVLFAQPLGWFEASNLPAAYFTELPRLSSAWREHRDALFDGTILPLGDAPDGTAWTGFISITPDRSQAYALIFRETNDQPSATIPLPAGLSDVAGIQVLHASPDAALSSAGAALAASFKQPRSYVFAMVRFA